MRILTNIKYFLQDYELEIHSRQPRKWKLDIPFKKDSCLQPNSFDCGIMALNNAKCIADGTGLNYKHDSESLVFYRKQLFLEIHNQKFFDFNTCP